MNTDAPIFLGIDVGTGSARAGFFSVDGLLLAQSSCPIKIWYPQDSFVEQSSTNIWHAVCQATKTAYAAIPPQPIAGIGFDATCSLVVVNAKGDPLSVSPLVASQYSHSTSLEIPEEIPNVIVWMDHRAQAETEEINAQQFSVLDYIGGRMSLEMQTPKLLWLRRHRTDTWQKAAHFFDLPDFLTWKATGKTTRSLCSTTCKWTYLGHKKMWDAAYFQAIGLSDIVEEKFQRIGQHILPPGAPVGLLSAEAARELGLPANIPVSASAIDAHAGGIGTIGAMAGSSNPAKTSLQAPMAVPDIFSRRIALIAGTSSCHMAISPQPHFVSGIWGPYYGAMLPNMWLNEGGQSATGSLIDHIITTHHAYSLLKEKAIQQGITPYDYLNTQIEHLSSSLPSYSYLTKKLHIMPDFHGNRSPLADPEVRGMISGLTLHSGLDELTLLYLATLQGLAYGTRQIIETLNKKGYHIDTVMVSGGQTKNPLFLQEHANATQCRIVLPKEQDAVLLGSAILGAVAGGVYPSIPAAMAAMSHIGHVIEPGEASLLQYHTRKYSVFLQMQKNQYEYNTLMSSKTL
ncbi:FGGY-family carbohydrate kinase [Entomobacter blattae]|uniref:Ribulokinase n=1 Tax=Entomobacter blattae TaxID=2762277 RepID=A0A7H1NTX5_9PROT|nr:FGGY-family carbohydrate kinase [Entomobacter blattae]QNT79235.1 Ribulokinase [Entomobacter blattae]